MKVGDLVQLSAYGKKLTCNYHQINNVGIVVKLHGYGDYYLQIQWAGHEESMQQIRRDLKHVR